MFHQHHVRVQPPHGLDRFGAVAASPTTPFRLDS